jgi:hypothetical protein
MSRSLLKFVLRTACTKTSEAVVRTKTEIGMRCRIRKAGLDSCGTIPLLCSCLCATTTDAECDITEHKPPPRDGAQMLSVVAGIGNQSTLSITRGVRQSSAFSICRDLHWTCLTYCTPPSAMTNAVNFPPLTQPVSMPLVNCLICNPRSQS